MHGISDHCATVRLVLLRHVWCRSTEEFRLDAEMKKVPLENSVHRQVLREKNDKRL